MTTRARRFGIAVTVSVLMLLVFGLSTVLELWHDYLFVRVVAGLVYSLLGAIVGYIAGTHRTR